MLLFSCRSVNFFSSIDSKRFSKLCEKYYGFADFYEILGIKKSCSDVEIKKAYYKTALKIHPDKVPKEKQVEAAERFKVITKIKEILLDSEKKFFYDKFKRISSEEDTVSNTWLVDWQQFFKPITDVDIEKSKIQYIGE